MRITLLVNVRSDFIPLVDEFNRSQSSIYVELTSTRADNRSADAFVRSLATGEYDIFQVPPTFALTLIATESLLPLDRFLATAAVDTSHDGEALA